MTDSRVVVALGGAAFAAGGDGVVVVDGVALVVVLLGVVVVLADEAPVEPEQPASRTAPTATAIAATTPRLRSQVEVDEVRAFGKRFAPRRPNLTA